jgi:hypothetical protein
MAHNNQITAFNAPLNDGAGPFIPFAGITPPLHNGGVVIGPRLFGPAEYFFWDTIGMMDYKYINRPTFQIYGDIRGGKTSIAKIYAWEGGAIYNGRREARVYADNHRRLAGVDEYGRLARLYDSEMINLDEKINPFDVSLGLSTSDHLETAVAIFESYYEGLVPSRHMKLAMRVALHLMFDPQQKETPSAELFAKILLMLRQEHGVGYTESILNVIRKEDVPQAPEGEVMPQDGENYLERIMDVHLTKEELDVSNIQWDDFMADAGLVAEAVLGFLDGEYGQTFGGTSSFGDKFGQRFAGIDFSHKNDQTVAFLIALVLKVKNSATLRRDRRFMFDIEIMDENSALWEIPTFARAMAKRLKHARSEDTTLIQISHRPQDYATVGDAGSQVRSLAVNSRKDIGAVLFARFEDEENLDYIEGAFGLTPVERAHISQLNPGQYGLHLPGRPMYFFQADLTPVRKWLVESDAAMTNALVRAS